jgi:hypothetical protein
MKAIPLFILIFCLCPNPLPAQELPWYRVGLTYYKISTAVDGIYRIRPEHLLAAGISPKKTDPRDFRLYHRGQEVPLFVAGQEDGRLDAEDYMDFLGSKNDATLDQRLYGAVVRLPNPYINTYSDTTAYFLVITPGEAGKRMPVLPAPSPQLPRASSFGQVHLQVFAQQYAQGETHAYGIRSSSFDPGQGWMGTLLAPSLPLALQVDLPQRLAPGAPITLTTGWVGRSLGLHRAHISIGDTEQSFQVIDSLQFDGFASFQQQSTLGLDNLPRGAPMQLRLQLKGKEAGNYASLSYLQVGYKQPMADLSSAQLPLIFDSDQQQVAVFAGGTRYLGYVGEDAQHMHRLAFRQEGDSLYFQIGGLGKASLLWLLPEAEVLSVPTLQPVRFRDYLAQAADYLLIGHRQLEQPSLQHANPLQAYADYRASAAGGGFRTLLLRIDELYDQFSYGERTPLAVIEFLKAYYPIHRPKYLLLAGRAMVPFAQTWQGDSSVFYRNHPHPFEFQDLVPAGGFPFSDKAYLMELDSLRPGLTAFSVGRIPAKNAQQLADYLAKVMEKDSLQLASGWPSRVLHLSGGISARERERHASFLEGFAELAQDADPGVTVRSYAKQAATEVEPINLSQEINAGIALLTFFGHGSAAYNELDFGFVSNDSLGYANAGKYPLLLINGCDYASAYQRHYTQGEDWVMNPKKGASALLASSSVGVDIWVKRYTELLYRAFFSEGGSPKTLGQQMQDADEQFVARYGTGAVPTAHLLQFVLLGDPAQRVFSPLRKKVTEEIH